MVLSHMGPLLPSPYLVLTVLDAHNTENKAPNHHGNRLAGAGTAAGVTLGGLGCLQPAFGLQAQGLVLWSCFGCQRHGFL